MKSKGSTSPNSSFPSKLAGPSSQHTKLISDSRSSQRKPQPRNLINRKCSTSTRRKESESSMSENLEDEERENLDEPNKPNEISQQSKVITAAASTFILENLPFSPLLKKEQDQHNQRTQTNLIRLGDQLVGEEEEIKEDRPLQTEGMDIRLTGAARKYIFESQPVIKRLRSQTSMKEPLDADFSAIGNHCKGEFTMQFENNFLRHGSPQQQQHESIENLYTLKKVQSKVRDKQIKWIEFSSTSATFNKQPDDTQTTMNRDLPGTTDSLQLKLSQIAIRKKQYGSPQDKMKHFNFFEPITNSSQNQQKREVNKKEELDMKDFHEESLCVTEENRYENVVNPIKLADLGWSDDYKLDKLMHQQVNQVNSGQFDPEAYFGGITLDIIEEGFLSFELSRREFEWQLVKRKSSGGGLHANSTFVDDAKYQTGDFNQKLLLSLGEVQLDHSSSDDEGDDEAEKFVQQTIKNTFMKNTGSKFHTKNEKNLLLQVDDNDELEEADDYNRKTPKMLSSDDEDNLEKKTLQLPLEVLEELKDESREESQRDSNTMFYIPQQLQRVTDLHQQILDQKFIHIVGQIDQEVIKETRSNRTGGSYAINNRMHDSDIFVMSNTTFDEDMTSKSSRRVSLGKQPYKNELLNFVNSNEEMKILNHLHPSKDQKEINEITSRLFMNQQQAQRRQIKYNNQYKKQMKKDETVVAKPFNPSMQTSMINNQTMISGNQQSITVGKPSNVTKFSNYLSFSNNLTPTPQGYQKVYQRNKDSKHQVTKIKINSQFNSISSFNGGLQSQMLFSQAQNTQSMNSVHQSIISNTSQQMKTIKDRNRLKVQKCNSNDNLSRQTIAINTSQIQIPQIITKTSNHSPQCSFYLRQNLSPGPGYKVKERNSMFDSRQAEGELNSKFVMLKPNEFCSNKNERLSGKVSKVKCQSNKRPAVMQDTKKALHNRTLGSGEIKPSLTASKLKESTSDQGDKQQCLMDTSSATNSMATFKLLASIKQSIINKKVQEQMRSETKIDQVQSEEFGQKLTRQRSKSEIETIDDIRKRPLISPTYKACQGIKHINKPIGSGPLSPSKSMKTIGMPYQGKTMADINKFSEERDGCRSVMNKHRYMNTMAKDESKHYISVDQSKTFDVANLSQQSTSNLNQSPHFHFNGKETIVSAISLEQTKSCSNSPLLWNTDKSRQAMNSNISLNFGIQPHHSVELQKLSMISNKHASQQKREACTASSVMKQRIQKSPCKKSMMTLNSSIGSNSNNASIIGAQQVVVHGLATAQSLNLPRKQSDPNEDFADNFHNQVSFAQPLLKHQTTLKPMNSIRNTKEQQQQQQYELPKISSPIKIYKSDKQKSRTEPKKQTAMSEVKLIDSSLNRDYVSPTKKDVERQLQTLVSIIKNTEQSNINLRNYFKDYQQYQQYQAQQSQLMNYYNQWHQMQMRAQLQAKHQQASHQKEDEKYKREMKFQAQVELKRIRDLLKSLKQAKYQYHQKQEKIDEDQQLLKNIATKVNEKERKVEQELLRVQIERENLKNMHQMINIEEYRSKTLPPVRYQPQDPYYDVPNGWHDLKVNSHRHRDPSYDDKRMYSNVKLSQSFVQPNAQKSTTIKHLLSYRMY